MRTHPVATGKRRLQVWRSFDLSIRGNPRVTDVSTQQDGIIHVMPEALANKIAAGEVVQRPASVLKELVENALDAGATDIDVIIKASGSALVQVIDNGSGMGPADARASFKRHATSKIRSAKDLDRLHTLGFRGEALASIAAVAQVELKTRRVGDDAGLELRLEGGEVTHEAPCATPSGTSMAVRNLFYNVPARRNFLKTPATEFKHLVETFQFLSLANPDVSFRLTHNGNEVYRLVARREEDQPTQLRHRIGELFGDDRKAHLVRVAEETSYLSVSGFIGDPSVHRRTRGEQFLFVNGRYVKHYYLDHALKDAYEGMIPSGAYPFYALFLRLDPQHVDVNVHPTKAEVKFDDESGVYGMLKTVARRALGMIDWKTDDPDTGALGTDAASPAASTPSFEGSPFAPSSGEGTASGSPSRGVGSGGGRGATTPPQRPWTGPSGAEAPGDLSQRLYDWSAGDAAAPPEPAPQTEIASAAVPQQTDTPDLDEDETPLWQLHERYILTQIHSGLMVVDQTAAHERILYERALASMENGFGLSQQLLFPHRVTLNPADHDLVQELLPHLRALGFDVSLEQQEAVEIRGVPTDIRPGDEETILADVIEQYRAAGATHEAPARKRLARSMAQRSAMPAGTRLSMKAMRGLINELFQCSDPLRSPRGDRTIIRIAMDDLAHRFHQDTPR